MTTAKYVTFTDEATQRRFDAQTGDTEMSVVVWSTYPTYSIRRNLIRAYGKREIRVTTFKDGKVWREWIEA